MAYTGSITDQPELMELLVDCISKDEHYADTGPGGGQVNDFCNTWLLSGSFETVQNVRGTMEQTIIQKEEFDYNTFGIFATIYLGFVMFIIFFIYGFRKLGLDIFEFF